MKTSAISICPRFHHAVELIGRRWTGAIIKVLLEGRVRFNGITAAIPEMSDRMLSERLRELEQKGIIERLVIPETPVRVEYELTEKGRALEGAMCAVGQWAETWIELPATSMTQTVEPATDSPATAAAGA